MKRKQLPISPTMHRYIFQRDDGICIYCGSDATEVDHVIPTKDGGKSIKGNLVCVCRKCNCKKAWNINNPKWFTTAIFWLLRKGEDTSWMDNFYKKQDG